MAFLQAGRFASGQTCWGYIDHLHQGQPHSLPHWSRGRCFLRLARYGWRLQRLDDGLTPNLIPDLEVSDHNHSQTLETILLAHWHQSASGFSIAS